MSVLKFITQDRVEHRGLMVSATMLAMFMHAMDLTIAQIALPHMMGAMTATQDQIAWVLTSYVVASAIFTPFAGFMATKFGRKNVLLI